MYPSTSVDSIKNKRRKKINNAVSKTQNNLLIKRMLVLLLTFYDNKVSWKFGREISACKFYYQNSCDDTKNNFVCELV